jgi:hypothetical protein
MEIISDYCIIHFMGQKLILNEIWDKYTVSPTPTFDVRCGTNSAYSWLVGSGHGV